MIRFIISAILMLLGLFVVLTAMVGNYRFGYVLNRMHVGATADTLAAFFIISSLIIANGFNAISTKLILMLAFLWFANPVSSHFLAKTEIITNEKITEEVEVVYHDSI